MYHDIEEVLVFAIVLQARARVCLQGELWFLCLN